MSTTSFYGSVLDSKTYKVLRLCTKQDKAKKAAINIKTAESYYSTGLVESLQNDLDTVPKTSSSCCASKHSIRMVKSNSERWSRLLLSQLMCLNGYVTLSCYLPEHI